MTSAGKKEKHPRPHYPLPPVDREEARHFPSVYASFELRAIAALIDMFLGIIVILPAQALSEFIWPMREKLEHLQELMLRAEEGGAVNPQAHMQALTELLQVYVPHLTAMTVYSLILIWLCWRYFGGTPGKLLLRLRIVDAETGAPLTAKQEMLRALGYIPSLLPLMLGFVWVMFDKRRRAWHDMIAGSAVIRLRRGFTHKAQQAETRPEDGAPPSA